MDVTQDMSALKTTIKLVHILAYPRSLLALNNSPQHLKVAMQR